MTTMICTVCEDTDWVCEDHRDLPWDGISNSDRACHCGGAGSPCPACNTASPPRFTAETVIASIHSGGETIQ